MSMIKYLGCAALLAFSTLTYAGTDTPWEITGGYANGNLLNFNDSVGVREYRVSAGYFPSAWHAYGINFGTELSYAHLHNQDLMYQGSPLVYNNLTVVTLTPVVRWYILSQGMFQPFLEGGAGPGWLSDTQFKDRHLGIHFTFQDFFGIGTLINTPYPIVAGIRILHYSNAGISQHNAGVTIPVMFYTGLRF